MISVEHLTKYYGNFLAVDDISFHIEEGHVYGFLGPNGAGKSTTMNIMTGCLSATSGHVRIDGHDIFEEPDAAKRQIGYLPEHPPLYLNDTPMEYLRFVGEAKGLRGEELDRQVGEVIRKTGIAGVRNRRISNLSKGYRQRVGIAQANPKVIILDEPTVGLDPLQIIEIRDLIRPLGEKHTVILSSHILSEVQAICESALIIAHGKLVAFDTPQNLEKMLTAAGRMTLCAEATPDQVQGLLAGVSQVTGCQAQADEAAGGCRAELTLQGDANAAARAIFLAFAKAGRPILQMTPVRADLENIFIELTEDEPSGKKEPIHESGI